jgi:hypothetical protein
MGESMCPQEENSPYVVPKRKTCTAFTRDLCAMGRLEGITQVRAHTGTHGRIVVRSYGGAREHREQRFSVVSFHLILTVRENHLDWGISE